MISTEHLRAEPYIYRTVPYIYRTEPNHHIPARKINRTVPYRGYVRLALDTIEREPNRIDGEMYGTVRFGTDSPLCWLPSEYRPSMSTVRKRTIAIGCSSGQVLLIRFNPDISYIYGRGYRCF